MKNKVALAYLLVSVVGFLSSPLHADKKSKKVSIDKVFKGKKVAHYWVKTDYIQKAPLKPVQLIDLIEDLIELQPKAHGYSLSSKRHGYYITCMAQTQTNMQDEEFIKLLVDKRLFIISVTGLMLGTIGGLTYRLEHAERVKATLKNPEQIELVVSVRNKK